MSGETERSDFAGMVAMAAVAVLDGCPWVAKGHLWELSSAVAALVVERAREVDSLLLPDGTLFKKNGGDPCPDCWQPVEEKQNMPCELGHRTTECPNWNEALCVCLDQLIEASSLGAPAAKAFRESVSDEDVDRIMYRVNEADELPRRRSKTETYGGGASDFAPSHTQKHKRRRRWHR